jgi:hypothetical protein
VGEIFLLITIDPKGVQFQDSQGDRLRVQRRLSVGNTNEQVAKQPNSERRQGVSSNIPEHISKDGNRLRTEQHQVAAGKQLRSAEVVDQRVHCPKQQEASKTLPMPAQNDTPSNETKCSTTHDASQNIAGQRKLTTLRPGGISPPTEGSGEAILNVVYDGIQDCTDQRTKDMAAGSMCEKYAEDEQAWCNNETDE